MVVVSRHLLDWRNATRGKWRPAAATVRLGPEAVALERLIHRDGLSRQEAIALLAARSTAAPGDAAAMAAAVAALDALADRLPPRMRRAFVHDLADDALGQVEFTDPVVAAEQRAGHRAVRVALRRACAALPAADRHLLALRYGRARTVRAIGDELGTDPKPLYRRLDRVLKTLRHSLLAMGVDGGTVQQPLNG